MPSLQPAINLLRHRAEELRAEIEDRNAHPLCSTVTQQAKRREEEAACLAAALLLVAAEDQELHDLGL
jgi:hypothetical protein